MWKTGGFLPRPQDVVFKDEIKRLVDFWGAGHTDGGTCSKQVILGADQQHWSGWH